MSKNFEVVIEYLRREILYTFMNYQFIIKMGEKNVLKNSSK